MAIRTRFAPSPTGFLHVGSLRTALYSYLIAKQNNGQFLLRIEDTDQKRLVPGGIENIVNSLNWAGINADEGVGLDKNGKIIQIGKYGPYIQSQRLEIYKKCAQDLLDKGHAYHCFCSSERLEELRSYQEKNKMPTGYDGHCRDLDNKEAQQRIKKGEPSVVRMKMPKTGETVLNDLIRGEVVFKNELVDDQIIVKSDGFPTYHLAVVVDDYFMEITHVIRGEEWLSSTPKHIQLYQFFGWDAPQFAHLPQLVNKDRSKLSKRQGDVAADDFAKKGYLPEAMVNFIAFLGWNPGDNREIFSLKELIKEFSLEKVNKSGAYFNLEKLDWYNREYLKNLSLEELYNHALPFFETVEYFNIKDVELLKRALPLERERVTTLAELPEALKFVFELPKYDSKILIWKKNTVTEAKNILLELTVLLNNFSVQQWKANTMQAKVGEWITENGYGNGNVLWPLRVALSGQEKSPGPFEIAEVLGKDETMCRLKEAIEKL